MNNSVTTISTLDLGSRVQVVTLPFLFHTPWDSGKKAMMGYFIKIEQLDILEESTSK